MKTSSSAERWGTSKKNDRSLKAGGKATPEENGFHARRYS